MASSTKPLIELFVKVSHTDKREKGPSLIGQQWFMTMYRLVEQGLIDLRLTPMSLEVPPPNYTQLNAARHLPIAWIESGLVKGEDLTGLVIASSEDLEAIMSKLGSPNLHSGIDQKDVWQAEEVFSDLYINLMNFIRLNKWNPLLNTLRKLDDYIGQKSKAFLLTDEVTYVDCQLMPKLQHVRVAIRAYKNMDIPVELEHLYSYIRRMYETNAFTASCPLDRDILMHYAEKDNLPKSFRFCLMGPERLLSVPESAISGSNINGR